MNLIDLFKHLAKIGESKETENLLGDLAFKKELKFIKENRKYLRGVEYHAADDCCAYCRKFKNKKYDLNHIHVLPHAGCTNKMGCRCTMYPLWKV